MNQLIQPKRKALVFLAALLLMRFVLSPSAQAVSPAPDGGYPGGNTAEGQSALLSLTTGGYNTAVGFFALYANTTGTYNTAVGAGALDLNTADNNTAIGTAALLLNTTGTDNTANGVDALAFNDTGSANTASGAGALFMNTIGERNAAIGFNALYSNTTGSFNTAAGFAALVYNTAGIYNTATGIGALGGNTTGSDNTATGANALGGNGTGNTANGASALSFNTTGDANTAIGDQALLNNTAGSNNTVLGFFAGFNVTTASDVICIGHNVGGANVSNTCFIGNIRDVTTQNADAIPVLIDSAGQLGTGSSSRRFKKEIKPMDKASEAILALKPVMFHYKSDKTNSPEFGLIAEEVAAVNPDLVVRNKNGEIYTVRYDAVNAMLLNEFLKEHRKVQQLERQVKMLTAGLQKVSAQLEMSNPAPQTVLNSQ